MKRIPLMIVAGALAAAPALAESPWIHVRVEEAKRDSRVAVNVPVSLAEALLSAAPEKIASKGRIHLEEHDLSIADMRHMWEELKKVGDAEIVSVESAEETVKVSRQGDKVLVRVDHAKGKGTVRVEVPISVVDALFSGDGHDVNLRAALGEVAKLRGDIVQIEDQDSKVRVWVDEKSN